MTKDPELPQFSVMKLSDQALLHVSSEQMARDDVEYLLQEAAPGKARIGDFSGLENLSPEQMQKLQTVSRKALQAQIDGKSIEALKHWQEALLIDPDRYTIQMNIAACLSDAGQWAEANETYEAITKKTLPMAWMGEAQMNWAWTQMRQGNLEEGWGRLYYRTRSITTKVRYSHYYLPVWSEPENNYDEYNAIEALSGKKILIWLEQGIGDQIIYASMIPDLVKAVGPYGKVGICCDQRLIDVFGKAFNECMVGSFTAGPEKDNPAHGHWYLHCGVEWDFQMSFADLGLLFRPNESHFPEPKPYLESGINRELSQKFRTAYQSKGPGKPVIGLCWTSTAARLGHLKSVNLKDLIPVLQKVDAVFLSLQYTAPNPGDVKIGNRYGILEHVSVDPKGDLGAVFAQVAACDAVITCSNTTAHIAGSLGIPTCLLLPEGRARLWYWMRQFKHCPWYPSVKYFHQENGHWYKAVRSIIQELRGKP